MLDVEGKKLMAELFYLYGVMLLLMDKLVIGPVRERILIACYRYKVILNQICISKIN